MILKFGNFRFSCNPSGEIFVKSGKDYWIACKKSDLREVYVIVCQKNANLILIDDEVKQLCNTHFSNIFFMEWQQSFEITIKLFLVLSFNLKLILNLEINAFLYVLFNLFILFYKIIQKKKTKNLLIKHIFDCEYGVLNWLIAKYFVSHLFVGVVNPEGAVPKITEQIAWIFGRQHHLANTF